MHRVDAPGSIAGMFSDGNPAIGQQATQVRAEWLNDLQENVCAVVEGAEIDLEKGEAGQLLAAIQSLVGGVAGGRLISTRVITANTTYVPTEGASAVEVTVVGGGGGGGGSAAMSASQFAAGGGGGSGAYATSYLTTGFSGVAVTIGAGGAGGVGGGSGSNGGTTSFGALSATGGTGGSAGPASTVATVQSGGAGGTASGANRISSRGMSGLPGIAFASGNMTNGAGGNSHVGAGGNSFTSTSTGAGNAGGGYGGGGSGAMGQNSAGAQNGGAGAAGVVIIREYA